MIVVIDTNVWISALQFARPDATPRRALAKAMQEDIIAACEQIEAVLRTLITKFNWPRREALNAIEVILLKGICVSLSGTVKACRDPHDDMFLECAEIAGADLLISGDKDLLALGSYKRTRIVNPAAYLLTER